QGIINANQSTTFPMNVVNQGTINVNASSSFLSDLVNEGTFNVDQATAALGSTAHGVVVTNSGVVKVQLGTVNVMGSIRSDGLGTVIADPASMLVDNGDMLGGTRNADQFNPLGRLVLNGSGTPASPQFLEAMGLDQGLMPGGFRHNFVCAELSLG